MRRLFAPRWILVHVSVALLILLMVNLGFWQLNRLDAKKIRNESISAQIQRPAVDLSTAPTFDALGPEWSKVVLKGEYSSKDAITIINRSLDGAAGYNSALPFITTNGQVVLVNRGFVPLATSNPPAPSGTLQILGYVRQTQKRSAVGAIDSSSPDSTEFQRFDLSVIANATDTRLLTNDYVQLIAENPATKESWPTPVALPTLDEGSHLSYAFQWFFFTATALTGWIYVVRKKLREPINDPAAPEQTSV
jgi:cytochrome oxidase assembly protein ShyY1